MRISKLSKLSKVKSKKRISNPTDIPSNRLIAVKYIQEVAETINDRVAFTVRDIPMKELDTLVKRIYLIQQDLNIIGLGLPKYLSEEPKKKWANDPERWI